MNNLLEGKVIIVTGAGRGIGQAMAKLFADNGAIVYANDIVEGAVETWSANYFNPTSGEVRSAYFDICNDKEVRSVLMAIKKECGHIDGLVNNAGVEYNELIGMISEENMESMFRVNVFGVIEMILAVSRIMARNEIGGSIINISSMVGLRGNPGQLVYSATKGAVISITKSAAKELASKKIRVNSIAPGLTKTEMMSKADLSKLQSRIDNISMGRIANPDDIAGGCLLLATDYSEYISGQVLPVDGCTII